MSAPTTSFEISTAAPGDEPGQGRLPLAQAAAAVTEQLASLASQAEQWHRALLRTSSDIDSLTGAYTQAGGNKNSAGPTSGTAAVDLLSGLLHEGAQTAWLHTGAVDPGALGPFGALGPTGTAADAGPRPGFPMSPGAQVHALLAGWPAAHTGRCPEDLWRGYAAEVRVAGRNPLPPGAPRDLVLVDRRLAVVAWRSGDGRICADTVAEPFAAALLGTLWDLLWEHALPLESAVRLESLARDEVKREILEQLDTGAKDEVIARSLGISLRTCRRHVAEILTAAGAISRFQAGARLSRAGVFNLPSA